MNDSSIAGKRRRRLSLTAGAFAIGALMTMGGVAAPNTVSPRADAALLAKGISPHPIKLIVPEVRPLSAMALLGRKLFNDTNLSGSGKMACASCHDDAHCLWAAECRAR